MDEKLQQIYMHELRLLNLGISSPIYEKSINKKYLAREMNSFTKTLLFKIEESNEKIKESALTALNELYASPDLDWIRLFDEIMEITNRK